MFTRLQCFLAGVDRRPRAARCASGCSIAGASCADPGQPCQLWEILEAINEVNRSQAAGAGATGARPNSKPGHDASWARAIAKAEGRTAAPRTPRPARGTALNVLEIYRDLNRARPVR